jgi:pimeloyl-ACP methyl ester carboxylesterase
LARPDVSKFTKEIAVATFVLIHGSFHGGWCWEKIVPKLREAGHIAIAPDLPGMALEETVPLKDVTLSMQADFVADIVRSCDGPVVLVGHSLGGIAIGEVAERVPEKVAGTVYLAAMLIPAGKSVYDMMVHRGDAIPISTISEDGTEIFCIMDQAPLVFYNDCEPEDIERALSRLLPQPRKPGLEPLTVTAERFGRVPRAYVECLRDNAMPIAFQRLLQQIQPCDPVYTMDTGHSPFLSAPDETTRHLIAAAEHFALAR